MTNKTTTKPNQSAKAITVKRPYPRSSKTFSEKTLTKQAMAADANINNILKKFDQTGVLPGLHHKQPQYMDCPDSIDFHTSLNIVKDAENAFSALPSELQRRFGHDPAHYMEFLSDNENYDEALELGLLDPTLALEPNTPPADAQDASPTPVDKPVA